MRTRRLVTIVREEGRYKEKVTRLSGKAEKGNLWIDYKVGIICLSGEHRLEFIEGHIPFLSLLLDLTRAYVLNCSLLPFFRLGFLCSLCRKIVAIGDNKNYSWTMVSFEKIESVARKIEEQTKAQAVFFFGSYARNQARMHSDVDLTS